MNHPNDATPFFMFLAFVCLAGFILWIGFMNARRRRLACEAVARQLGLRFRPGRDKKLPARLRFLNDLAQGHSRYALNIMEGTYKDHAVTGFDFHYTTGSGKNSQHHSMSFFLLHLEKDFPELRVYPENFLSKIGQALGYADIDFESIEFSNAFTVRSRDKKFAYDICHTRMMEYLLRHRSLAFEIEGRCLAIPAARLLAPEDIPGGFELLIQLRSLFPAYLTEA